jgi:hypothetical protein
MILSALKDMILPVDVSQRSAKRREKAASARQRSVRQTGDSLIRRSWQVKIKEYSVAVQVEKSEGDIEFHHRGTERTEAARRLEHHWTLCATSVLSVSAVVNRNSLHLQFQIDPPFSVSARRTMEKREGVRMLKGLG